MLSAPTLTALRALIPRSLLDGPGWESLLERVGKLPGAAVASSCGFEFRLDETASTADFSVSLGPGLALTEHYIREGKAATPGSAAAALARYLVRHCRSESSVTDWISGTMLEYDVAEVQPGQHPAPGMYLKLRRTRRPDGITHYYCTPRVLTATLTQAVGWTTDTGEQGAVERVFGALPTGGEVVYAGVLPGRAPRSIRLVVGGIEEADLPALLERLGWRGSIRTVAAVLTDLRDRLPRFRLSVDVTAQGLSPRLGLEMYLEGEWDHHMWLTTGRSDWRLVVERLTERGWCLPEKAQGLLAWCVRDRVYDREGVFLVYKGINHVKLTIEDSGVHAKAYAGLHFAPLQPPA